MRQSRVNSLNDRGLDALTTELDQSPGKSYVTAELVARPTLTYNLKALVTFLQLSTALVRVVEIQWPSGFSAVLNALQFVNFDFVPWQTLGCVVKVRGSPLIHPLLNRHLRVICAFEEASGCCCLAHHYLFRRYRCRLTFTSRCGLCALLP